MTNSNTTLEELIGKFNEINLPRMAAELERQYNSPDFLTTAPLDLISSLLESEYDVKASNRLKNRLRDGHLKNCPQQLDSCHDSPEREYLPHGIVDRLKRLDFIKGGMNVCVLGASDSGKTYLAKAIGVHGCHKYRVHYYHCTDLLESLAVMKNNNYKEFNKQMKKLLRTDLLVLDDFLLHTVSSEEEVKILFALFEGRHEGQKSTMVCSQRDPKSWKSMIMNDEVSANAIVKRATKHYTVAINIKSTE